MKIAIISAYDSGVDFSVYLNGVVIDKDTILGYYNNKTQVIRKKYKKLARSIFNAYRESKYDLFTIILDEYDTIFLCEDGYVEKLK